MKHNTKDTTGD